MAPLQRLLSNHERRQQQEQSTKQERPEDEVSLDDVRQVLQRAPGVAQQQQQQQVDLQHPSSRQPTPDPHQQDDALLQPGPSGYTRVQLIRLGAGPQQQQQHDSLSPPYHTQQSHQSMAESATSVDAEDSPLPLADFGEQTGCTNEITQDMVQKMLSQLPPEKGRNSGGGSSNSSRISSTASVPSPAPLDEGASEDSSSARQSVAHGPARPNKRPLVAERALQNAPQSKKQRFARAVKVPPDGAFGSGLPAALIDSLQAGGPELNSLQHQKLVDATGLLQSISGHVLEPLTLYTKKQLYELMASITEVWKNSGKSAWRKRINKIKGNARSRKVPRNVLDAKELAEIAELEAKIRQREIWEQQEKLKMSVVEGRGPGSAATAETASVTSTVPSPSEIPHARKTTSARTKPQVSRGGHKGAPGWS